ncbi:hypothetical protein F3Y22_tig00116997pilonHSYRG00610 [Hibiscus syriacus]|uniref:Uncharacterized protein n=1 Tax=Hibiscus syriacus TaxID=106335 RepID=A0A6A2XSL9_HIBSY|nr:hypothetical protein F3Y22_tig00116997pilonHSYRG00610 [Hibiscus syriacus]
MPQPKPLKQSNPWATLPVQRHWCCLMRVVVPCLVHLKHIVLCLLVPEGCKEGMKSVIVSPKGIVDAGVPAFVSANDVVSGGDSAKYQKNRAQPEEQI